MCATLPAIALVVGTSSVVVWSTALLAIVSFIDDIGGLAIGWRFLAHLVAATAFACLVLVNLPIYGRGLLILSIIWMINLYNFMDGSDGLAGGMTVIGFAVYAVASWQAGDLVLCSVSSSIAAAALAFLFFNFHPARVFLGDAGSVPLGFLTAAIGLSGWSKGLWPLWFPVLVFSPFIVDATLTLVRRIVLRERFWRAHRSHYYQRLVQMGLGHRRTAQIEYALMISVAVTALWGRNQELTLQVALLSVWAVVYALMAGLVDRVWHRRVARSGDLLSTE